MDENLTLRRRQILLASAPAILASLGSGVSPESPTHTSEPSQPGEDGNGDSDPNKSDKKIHNVLDFGAKADGVTDDRSAIQTAITDAAPGDTIYFPATSDSYIINPVSGPWESGEEYGIYYDPNAAEHPNALTFLGEGRNSILRTAPGQTANNILFNIEVTGDVSAQLSFLTLDGNKQNQDTQEHRNIGFRNYTHKRLESKSNEVDIVLTNCWGTNFGSAIFEPYTGGITINRCTAWSGDSHGFNPNPREPTDPPVVITNCYAHNMGLYGCDASDGKHVIRNCVFENNNFGIKNTANTIESTWERVRVTRSANRGYMKSGDESNTGQRHHILMKDCIIDESGTYGLVTGDSMDLYIQGSVLVTNTKGSKAVNLRGNCNVYAEDAKICATNNAGIGLDSRIQGEDGATIGMYQYYQNKGGNIGESTNLHIDQQNPTNKTDLEGVPKAHEVGAKPRSYYTTNGPEQ